MSLHLRMLCRLLTCILAVPIGAGPLGKPDLDLLIRRLQSAETSAQAAEELLKLGKTDPSVRDYLAKRLPTIIEKGPAAPDAPWSNAVRLAGNLRLADASPALAKWIDAGSGTTGLSIAARLEDKPAAKALAGIGDPGIPAVVGVLSRGSLSERWEAAYVLYNVGSPSAMKALKEHLRREGDETLRAFIQRALGSK